MFEINLCESICLTLMHILSPLFFFIHTVPLLCEKMYRYQTHHYQTGGCWDRPSCRHCSEYHICNFGPYIVLQIVSASTFLFQLLGPRIFGSMAEIAFAVLLALAHSCLKCRLKLKFLSSIASRYIIVLTVVMVLASRSRHMFLSLLLFKIIAMFLSMINSNSFFPNQSLIECRLSLTYLSGKWVYIYLIWPSGFFFGFSRSISFATLQMFQKVVSFSTWPDLTWPDLTWSELNRSVLLRGGKTSKNLPSLGGLMHEVASISAGTDWVLLQQYSGQYHRLSSISCHDTIHPISFSMPFAV